MSAGRSLPRCLPILISRHKGQKDHAQRRAQISHTRGSISVAIDAGDPGSEWPAGLDIRGLLEQGWRPTPFREFVLKVHSRCNLTCDYCYIYEMADQSWRAQ